MAAGESFGLRRIYGGRGMKARNDRFYTIVRWTCAILLVLVIIGVIVDTECSSAECFVEKANNCEYATYEVTYDYGSVRYTAEDCYMWKHVLTINEDEDPELKVLIEDTYMYCGHEPGYFNEKWMTSLIADLEYCEGDLKDVLEKLVIFT